MYNSVTVTPARGIQSRMHTLGAYIRILQLLEIVSRQRQIRARANYFCTQW